MERQKSSLKMKYVVDVLVFFIINFTSGFSLPLAVPNLPNLPNSLKDTSTSAPNILKYAKKVKLYNTTRNIFRGFTRDQDLTTLNICHVFPPTKIYEILGKAFMNQDSNLKPLSAVDLENVRDFKRDIFKVHTDGAFLKDIDMPTKSRFFGLNANMQDQIEMIITSFENLQKHSRSLKVINDEDDNLFHKTNVSEDLNGVRKSPDNRNDPDVIDFSSLKKRDVNETVNDSGNSKKSEKLDIDLPFNEIGEYVHNLTLLTSLFYNAPANLRVTNSNCLNDDVNFEDPSLLTYSFNGKPSEFSKFTAQSRYLANKYSIPIKKDAMGLMKTTDVQKESRKVKINDEALKVKPQSVFELFFKNMNKGLRSSKQVD